jgi:hypothetical protein
MPDMNADANRLARLWDELVAGKHPPDAADAEFLWAIGQVEHLAYVPPAAPELVARSWEKLIEGVDELVPYELDAAVLKPTNGHHPVAVADLNIEAPAKRSTTIADLYRILAIAVMAGLIGGFFTGGWARFAMRLAGYLTIDRNRGLLTENDAVVGQITFGGTLFLAFTGAAFGVVVGLLYVAIRRWLPGNQHLKPVIFSVLLLGVFGFVIMDPSNPDYVTFGPAWLNVVSFSLGYIVIGTAVGLLVESLDRRIPKLDALKGSQWRRLFKMAGLAPFALIGMLAILVIGVGSRETAPLLMTLLMLAAILFWIMAKIVNLRSIRLPQSPIINYMVLAVPSLIGLFLTMRAVATILGG